MESAPPVHAAPRRAVRTAIAVIALVAAGAWFYRAAVRDNIAPKNFGVVEAGKIYRSGKLTPAAIRALHDEHGVRTIVDLGAWEAGSEDDRREQRTAEALGMERYRFELIGDGTGNPNYYVQTLRLMTDPAKQPVLVHCGAGAERTGIAVMLYRNVSAGTPIEEAYEEAKKHRHDPARNPRLRQVLERYAEPILAAYRDGTQIRIPGEVEPLPEPSPVAVAPAVPPAG